MQEELNSTIHLAIEIMLCAMLITAVAICGKYGYEMYYAKKELDTSVIVAETSAELFHYDNKFVTASDAVELILNNTRDYSYWFEVYSGGTLSNSLLISKRYELIPTAGHTGEWTYIDYWSESNIREILEPFKDYEYTATIVFDESNTYIRGVKFTYSS